MGILSKAVKAAAKRASKKEKEAAKKAAKNKKPAKKGKQTELEGARANPETQGSDRVARDVEAGRAGKVTATKGPGFLQQQRTASSRAVAKVKADLQRKVDDGTATKAERAELRALRIKDELDTSRAQQAAGQTAKANRAARAKAAQRTDYVDPESGEIVGKPTKRQVEAAMRNARARNMKPREREYRAFLEKEYGVDFNKGGAVKKTAMMRGGMANKKEHMYAAGGSVMDNLTSGQKRMVRAMAADNKK